MWHVIMQIQGPLVDAPTHAYHAITKGWSNSCLSCHHHHSNGLHDQWSKFSEIKLQESFSKWWFDPWGVLHLLVNVSRQAFAWWSGRQTSEMYTLFYYYLSPLLILLLEFGADELKVAIQFAYVLDGNPHMHATSSPTWNETSKKKRGKKSEG